MRPSFFASLVLASLSILVVRAADACNVGVLAGECLATSDCSSSGGKSTAGFCPGAADIQCCTYGQCKTQEVTGKCQPTDSCGGTSTAGICPGAENIQCCTKSAPAEPVGGEEPEAEEPAAEEPAAEEPVSGGACPPGINDATVQLVKEFEGFETNPEPDPIGLPTVGFGHLCQKANCAEVSFKFPLTESTAAQLLDLDMERFRKCVQKSVKVGLNDNQFGALSSFAFNLGCGSFESSTMLKRLNAGDNPNTVAQEEIPKFNKAGGKVLKGLTRRRNAEVDLFQKASSKKVIPC